MHIDFTHIEYLRNGNSRQQSAYEELTSLSIFEHLRDYNPILTGTIPIGIDLPESDLDIICQCCDHVTFAETLKARYGNKRNFKIQTTGSNELRETVATFWSGDFKIEIFGQDCPSVNQRAYRHMLIEHKILNSEDDAFRTEIMRLKAAGLKTEPAFARVLGLQGDPYEALLKYEIVDL
ncbi:DUF4269 domain-containing protein [Aestuariivivens sediminicola]|uniref:DUF4269 domain-containing protein n=1 Tax=Aestuariivivens sediminicola TaxID=2913560 RepID=UPI001F58B863|nr:DUF4269 domain-containing protein [Aestuariivivens sediminicola]